MIRAELAGIGQYVVCSILSKGLLGKIAAERDNIPIFERWENADLQRSMPMGFNHSLYVLEDPSDLQRPLNDGEICLTWDPSRLADAMLSHRAIRQYDEYVNPGSFSKEGFDLDINPFRMGGDGWGLHASFGNRIWDVIEAPDFPELLPAINRDIRAWWQDQTGHIMHGQYATVRAGVDGPVFMVYQPVGNGLWISGSRDFDHDHQMCDHNTDCAIECFSHIISLCIAQKHCRAASE